MKKESVVEEKGKSSSVFSEDKMGVRKTREPVKKQSTRQGEKLYGKTQST